MSTASLSFDQAPPISVPLRFFLAAPWFGVLAAAVLALAGPPSLASRWHPALIAATHLITLGALALCMIGALIQMLPVVAGAVIRTPVALAWAIHLPLVLGILLLAAGFALGWNLLLVAALPLLALALFGFAAVALKALASAAAANATVTAMRLALLALTVTAGLGLFAAWTYAGHTTLPLPPLADIHLAWGLLGWIGILVVGVAYQVVPMFQLTPPYPVLITKSLTWLLAAALMGLSLGHWPGMEMVRTGAALVLCAAFVVFAGTTLRLQRRRRRRLPDVTLRLWRLAMLSLLAAAAVWLLGIPTQESTTRSVVLGILWLIGFAWSAVNGMLYKIVPFLVWLHLQNLGPPPGSIPNMKQMIPDHVARHQALAHETALVCLLAACFLPLFFYPALIAAALSFALAGRNLLSAWHCYRHHAARLTEEKEACRP